MRKRIGIVSAVVVLAIAAVIGGRKLHKRYFRKPEPAAANPVAPDPTRTETFELKDLRPARFDLKREPSGAAEWTQFLGRGSQGHAVGKAPVEWSETTGVIWKTKLPSVCHSSPVVKNNQVWLTSADDEARSLCVLCLDATNGAIVRQIEIFHREKPPVICKQDSHASSTPVLDGDRLIVHFPWNGTACLATDTGAILWKNEDVHVDGPGGSSPALCGSLVIIPVDGVSEQYLAALDRRTGQLVWKTPRVRRSDASEIRRAYSTPVIVEVDGKQQIVSVAVDRAAAYEPATGEEIWHVDFRGHCQIPRPAIGDGLLFICTGWEAPQLWAIHAGGFANVTDSHVKWKVKRQVPHTSSPLVVGEEIYFVSDKGIASCVDCATGKVHWSERLTGAFSASPLFAGGNLYFFSEGGESHVLKPGKTFELRNTNLLDAGCYATPAIASESIYLRTPRTAIGSDRRPRSGRREIPAEDQALTLSSRASGFAGS